MGCHVSCPLLRGSSFLLVTDLDLLLFSVSQWSSWSSWSRCSASCGSGIQTRTRSCQRGSCPGIGRETRSCTSDGPSCHATWGSWSPWSSCSPSCGEKRERSRSRTCQGQGKCSGDSKQSIPCSDIACPQGNSQSGMSSWSPWGSCSRACGGYQMRRRSCLNASLGCSSPYYQFRRCSTSYSGCSSRFRSEKQQEKTAKGAYGY